MIFQESDITFNFEDARWQIKQYDTHRYYKILSGAGLKGVDFLGILNQEKVVFFEIKNFHSNHPTQTSSYLIFDEQEKFIEKIADKLEDSVRAINVIIALMTKKRWYRLFIKWKKWIPRFLIKNKDWYFWHQIHQLGQQLNNQILVLWLEIDSPLSATDRQLLKKLLDTTLEKELTDFVGEVLIADYKHPVFETSLKVII